MLGLRRSLVLPCLVAVACRGGEPATKPRPIDVHAAVRDNPKNPIGALVDVTAPGAVECWVEHGDTPLYGERTTPARVPGPGRFVIPIIGLTPDATAHVRVRVKGPNGETGESGDLTFHAGPLPPGVPAAIHVKKNGSDASGNVLVGLYDSVRESFIAAMFDRGGRLRWFWVAPPPITPAAHFDRVRGHFLVVDGSSDTFYELDLAGERVASWRDTGSPQGLDGHDFVLLPNGNAMMIGWEFRAADARALFPGGREHALRADHTIDEIDPRGNVVFHWSSYDHVGIDEMLLGFGFDPTNFHVVHANSLEPLPDGDVLASFRTTSSVVKIDRKTGAIVWRLGGKKSDFKFVDDPSGGFSRQHDPHRLANGEIMLFDNGNDHTPRASRVARYALDESAHTARLTWEYHHDPELFSDVAGSARRLPNGDVLIGFSNGMITEIDESKKTVWEAETKPFALYRALYTPSLYP